MVSLEGRGIIRKYQIGAAAAATAVVKAQPRREVSIFVGTSNNTISTRSTYGDVTLYITDQDKVFCAAIANVSVDGHGSSGVPGNEVTGIAVWRCRCRVNRRRGRPRLGSSGRRNCGQLGIAARLTCLSNKEGVDRPEHLTCVWVVAVDRT